MVFRIAQYTMLYCFFGHFHENYSRIIGLSIKNQRPIYNGAYDIRALFAVCYGIKSPKNQKEEPILAMDDTIKST